MVRAAPSTTRRSCAKRHAAWTRPRGRRTSCSTTCPRWGGASGSRVVSDRPMPDLYAVLQVHPDAEPEVIEAAYRQLMRKYHPDRAGADPQLAASLHERAKQINQ